MNADRGLLTGKGGWPADCRTAARGLVRGWTAQYMEVTHMDVVRDSMGAKSALRELRGGGAQDSVARPEAGSGPVVGG